MKHLLLLLVAATLASCATTPEPDYCVALRLQQDWVGVRQVCQAWIIGNPKTFTRPEMPRQDR